MLLRQKTLLQVVSLFGMERITWQMRMRIVITQKMLDMRETVMPERQGNPANPANPSQERHASNFIVSAAAAAAAAATSATA